MYFPCSLKKDTENNIEKIIQAKTFMKQKIMFHTTKIPKIHIHIMNSIAYPQISMSTSLNILQMNEEKTEVPVSTLKKRLK